MPLKGTGRARGAWIAAATVLVLLAGGYACGILYDNGACPLEDPPGILIDILDAGSGRFVPHSANPTGFTVSGGVRQPMTLVPPNTRLAGGRGPLGARSEVFLYDVEVAAEGYQTWRTSGVSVEVDHCGNARTVEMTARLLLSTPTG